MQHELTERFKQYESELTREEFQALQNKRAGMLIFQISWIMAFICIVVVNWQMRFSPNWLPEGVETVSMWPGTLATFALLLSAFLVRRALIAIRTDNKHAFDLQWSAAIGLGMLFVAIMLFEFITIQTGTQYAQVFRLMTGFHIFHALVIGAYLSGVYLNAQKGVYSAFNFWAVEAGTKLWYFVLVAWLLFYTVIYLWK